MTDDLRALHRRLTEARGEAEIVRLGYALDLIEKTAREISVLVAIRDNAIKEAHRAGGGDHRIAKLAGVSNTKVRTLTGR